MANMYMLKEIFSSSAVQPILLIVFINFSLLQMNYESSPFFSKKLQELATSTSEWTDAEKKVKTLIYTWYLPLSLYSNNNNWWIFKLWDPEVFLFCDWLLRVTWLSASFSCILENVRLTRKLPGYFSLHTRIVLFFCPYIYNYF